MRARRRMFAIVTSALTGALVLAAPAAPAVAEPIKAVEPVKKRLSTQDVPATAAAALEETSDLFGNLGRDLEDTLNTGANLSTDLGKTADDPLNVKKDATDSTPVDNVDNDGKDGEDGKNGNDGKDVESSLAEASKLSRLVGRTAESLVNGVDDMIGSLDSSSEPGLIL